jgi:DNA-binding GntR family transcriptional regulator
MSQPDDITLIATLPQFGERGTLSDAVLHALREAITDGKLRPGTRLREVALARQFSVSATPVREALRRLEREGLVETSTNRGATVAAVSPIVLANLYELHETLEAFAVRRAAELGPHDLDPLRQLLGQIDESIAQADQTPFNRLDVRFHRTLNELSGNEQIAELIEQTHRRIQSARVHFDIHLPDRPKNSHIQHRQMLAAVAAGNADEAERIARLHISAIRDQVLTVLKEVPAADTRNGPRREVTPSGGRQPGTL